MTSPSLTVRIREFMRGHTSAAESLCQEILPELYRIAAREIRRNDRFFAPLSKTELVNELWVRRLAKGGWQIDDRRHFFAIAGKVMRNLLIDSARKRLTLQRGSGREPLSLEESVVCGVMSRHDAGQIVEMKILMDRMEIASPRAAQVVDLHYFCGYTFDEIAQQMDLTVKQVRSAWEEGKRLLRRALLVGAKRSHHVVALPGSSESKSLTMGLTNSETTEGLLTGSNS